NNRVGRVSPQGIFNTFVTMPTPFSRPNAIALGPDGNMWVTEDQAMQIAKISPGGQVLAEYRVPHANSGGLPTIVAGSDGNLWFTEPSVSQVAKIDPFTGIVTEYAQGIMQNSDPAYITTGPDGNLWFTQPSYPNSPLPQQVSRITTAGVVTSFNLPSTATA